MNHYNNKDKDLLYLWFYVFLLSFLDFKILRVSHLILLP